LVALNLVANGHGAGRAAANGGKHDTERRQRNTPGNNEAYEEHAGKKRVHRPTWLNDQAIETEVDHWFRDAGYAVFSACPFPHGTELQEVDHLGEGQRAHGKVNAATPQRQ